MSDVVEVLRGPQGWEELESPQKSGHPLTWKKFSDIISHKAQRVCWGQAW